DIPFFFTLRQAQGPQDEGQGPQDEGQGPQDEGQGPQDEGQGPQDEGQGLRCEIRKYSFTFRYKTAFSKTD
ncbi:MAG: hypothetical protein J6X78_09815, partial [Treponema sp.]|nr:hypothetical protein [Treponema sp.]